MKINKKEKKNKICLKLNLKEEEGLFVVVVAVRKIKF